jgi:hypothetical protein
MCDKACAPIVVIGYCIFGSLPKYCEGLLRNLEIIAERRPGWKVAVAAGSDAPAALLERIEATWPQACRVVRLPLTGFTLTVERMIQAEAFALDLLAGCMPVGPPSLHPRSETHDVPACFAFSRDADSRISYLDRACMEAFMASHEAAVHSVRDHLWHRNPIGAGCFGWRVRDSRSFVRVGEAYRAWQRTQPPVYVYGDDERFLAEVIYPAAMRVPGAMLIHSSLTRLRGERRGEHVFPLPVHREADEDLVTNAVLVDGPGTPDRPQFCFLGDLRQHALNTITWLDGQGAREEIGDLVRLLDPPAFPGMSESLRPKLLLWLYLSQYYTNAPAADVMSTFRMFRDAPVDQFIIDQSNFFLAREQAQGRLRIVGTTAGSGSLPETAGTLRIVYGSMPQDERCLPCGPIMWRHPLDASSLRHDAFHCMPGWSMVHRIAVITRADATDRYAALLCELCRIGAPVDRVVRYEARNLEGEQPYAGATRNHCEVLEAWTEALPVSESGPADDIRKAILVLEDDVAFTPDAAQIGKALAGLLERDPEMDFHVALLATSKFGTLRDHPTEPGLRYSHQPCTTSAAYLVPRRRAPAVAAVIREGYEQLVRTGDAGRFCVDRYWTLLQRGPGGRNGFVVFHPKLAYQRPTRSNLTGRINTTFD